MEWKIKHDLLNRRPDMLHAKISNLIPFTCTGVRFETDISKHNVKILWEFQLPGKKIVDF